MRYMIMGILTFLSLAVFGNNNEDSSLLGGIESIPLNYSLENSKQKKAKLNEMIKYEDFILHQLQIENEKYEKLVAKIAATQSESKSFRRLEIELTKQKKITLRLLNKADAVSRYIQWLRT